MELEGEDHGARGKSCCLLGIYGSRPMLASLCQTKVVKGMDFDGHGWTRSEVERTY